jgi:hypothetical protein
MRIAFSRFISDYLARGGRPHDAGTEQTPRQMHRTCYGGLMKYAADNYGVTATGITVSREQADLGRKIQDKLQP